MGCNPFVQTVLGAVDPDVLGWILPHEHLIIDWSLALGIQERPVESKSAIERALAWVRKASDSGVGGIVDAGMDVYGPSPALLLLLAMQSPVHIVASTGLFETDQLPPPVWALPPASQETIAQHFVRVASVGLQDSGVRPGIFKVATSPRAITEIEEACLRGAASAQLVTGLPIMTHSRNPSLMEAQVDILEDAGADLARVSIGHVGWMSGIDDIQRYRRLGKRGVMLGLDCIGSPARSLREYGRMVAELVQAGFASQILLSHDAVAYVRGIEGVYEREWFISDFAVIPDRFLPLLRTDFSLDEGGIRLMTVENPRRLLTVDPTAFPRSLDTILPDLEDEYLAWVEDDEAALP